MVWASCWLAGSFLIARVRRPGRAGEELAVRRRIGPWLVCEHAALALALASGAALMAVSGMAVGQHRWLDLKLGLVAFLVIPLEGMHAWVSHGWIARGLRGGAAGSAARDLERGIGMDDMVRTLSALLLGATVPFLVWLSLAQPF